MSLDKAIKYKKEKRKSPVKITLNTFFPLIRLRAIQKESSNARKTEITVDTSATFRELATTRPNLSLLRIEITLSTLIVRNICINGRITQPRKIRIKITLTNLNSFCFIFIFQPLPRMAEQNGSKIQSLVECYELQNDEHNHPPDS